MQTEKTRNIYKIANGVFYRKVSDRVYLRNVNTKSDYLFNEIVYDILAQFANPISIEVLLCELKKCYRIKDAQSFDSDIMEFVDELVQKRILEPEVTSLPPFKDLNLVSQVQELCTKDQRLWSACLEITYRCNEKCIHCYLDNPAEACKSQELTFEEYKRLIDELYDLGCFNVLVTGGEPTLREDFIDICEYIVSKGMLLDVFTNALYISDDLFYRLSALKLNSISFSLYGGTAEFHDSITRISGSFEKTLKNILKFKCAGFDIFVKTVLFKDHFDEFLLLRKMGESLNFKVYPSTIITPGHSGDIKSGMMLEAEDFRKLFRLEKADRLAAKQSGEPVKENLWRKMDDPICSAGYTQLSFAPNGDVFPCNAMPVLLGNVRNIHIAEIWNNSEKLQSLRKIRFGELSEKCSSCKYSGVCNVCLGAAFMENEGLVRPCSYTCEYAKMRYEEAF